MDLIEAVAGTMMVAGSALALLAAIGLVRFRDVFSRMQAASKPSTLGILLVLGGSALVVEEGVVKLLLVLVLQFMTVPIGVHLVARSVYRAGGSLNLESGINELPAHRDDTEK